MVALSNSARRYGTRLAATLAASAVLVMQLAVPAHAAPPTISASKEEIVFSIGATEAQQTIISWDIGDEAEAEVVMSKNGGSPSQWASTASGSKAFDVEPGTDTYQFCVQEDRDVFACVTVKSSVLLITPEGGEDKPDLKIDFDFIHDVEVKPSGYSADISYTTDELSIPAVLVSKKSPLPFSPISSKDQEVFDPSQVESSAMNIFGGPTTTHANQLAKLDPDTTYHFVIKALDETTGMWFQEKGTFQTLRRDVSVTFDSVTALDDSDDLSAGEFTFTFQIDGGGASGWQGTENLLLDTGESEQVSLTGTVEDASGLLELRVVGHDNDEFDGFLFLVIAETCGFKAPATSEGQDDCGEWTTAAGSFDVGPNVDAPNPESFTKPFTMVAVPKGDDSEVSFKVKGTYSVSFS